MSGMNNPIIFYDDRKSIEKSFNLLTEEITDYKNNNELSNNTKFMFDLEKSYKYEEIDLIINQYYENYLDFKSKSKLIILKK